MTAQRDPYVRVYYRIVDDDKFAAVYDDDARLACWLRLLLVADGTWPAPAPIPAGIRRGAFQHLVDVGLVDVLPGGRYRIHGMDSERGERREKAAAAARVMQSNRRALAEQPQSTSSTNGIDPAEHVSQRIRARSAPLRSEPLRSAPSVKHTRDDEAVWTTVLLIEELAGRGPSPKVTEDLRADVTQLGAEKVMDAIRSVHEREPGPLDAAGLVYGAHNALFPLPGTRRETPTERADREREEAIAKYGRRQPA